MPEISCNRCNGSGHVRSPSLLSGYEACPDCDANGYLEQDNAEKIAREMMDLADHFADTLEQPNDPRAWDHLLIYCPREALERRLATLAARETA